MIYEALYYDGYATPPAYYLIGDVEGDTPEQGLADSLTRITQEVREQLDLAVSQMSDEEIQEGICIVRADGFVSIRNLERLR